MNSKFGLILSTVLMLGGISLWSVSILAAEGVAASSEAKLDARSSAADAHREAAVDAVKSIEADNKFDLDIELIGRTSIQIAGD
jgi:hypothetical protein